MRPRYLRHRSQWQRAQIINGDNMENNSTAIQRAEPMPVQQTPASDAMSVTDLVGQITLIQSAMKQVMHAGEHYGTIPGCGDKPTLLKAGAEKLSFMFRLAPEYAITENRGPGEHREYQIVCNLRSTRTGVVMGSGIGSCSTMETKYRYRKAEQTCPACGKPTIIKGKKEYGGGWLCYAKKGGCGQKFNDGDPAIENQNMGRVEHDNPADYYNTCLKMGKKRAHVDAVLTTTAASDIFTQDVEDLNANGVLGTPPADAPVEHQGAPQAPQAPQQDFMEAERRRKALAAEKAGKPATAIPAGGIVVEGLRVKEVREKSGTSAKGPWLAFFVTFSDGTEAGTFSETQGRIAQDLAGKDETCTVKVKPGRKPGTLELVDIEPDGMPEEPGTTAEDLAHEDRE